VAPTIDTIALATDEVSFNIDFNGSTTSGNLTATFQPNDGSDIIEGSAASNPAGAKTITMTGLTTTSSGVLTIKVANVITTNGYTLTNATLSQVLYLNGTAQQASLKSAVGRTQVKKVVNTLKGDK